VEVEDAVMELGWREGGGTRNNSYRAYAMQGYTGYYGCTRAIVVCTEQAACEVRIAC